MSPFQLCLITDRRLCRGPLVDAIDAALAGGVDCVQLREKDLSGAELYNLAREIRTVTSRAGIPLVINDRIDVALAVRAHGVHLGAGSIPVAQARRVMNPGSLIGYSAHSLEEADGAVLAGADYVFFAPVFEPGSKQGDSNSSPQGVDSLWAVAAACPVPVYALGGITAERVDLVMNPSGRPGRPPAGVAAISSILSGPDITAQARMLAERLAAAAARAGSNPTAP